VLLFPTPIIGVGVDAQQGREYDVAPDGLLLINTVLDEAASPITLLQTGIPRRRSNARAEGSLRSSRAAQSYQRRGACRGRIRVRSHDAP
jgi:hypothetical protein